MSAAPKHFSQQKPRPHRYGSNLPQGDGIRCGTTEQLPNETFICCFYSVQLDAAAPSHCTTTRASFRIKACLYLPRPDRFNALLGTEVP